MYPLHLPLTPDQCFCVLRTTVATTTFRFSQRKKSWHTGQNSFSSVAVPHRAHRFGAALDASALIPFVLSLFIAHLRSTMGRCSDVLPASLVKVPALELLSAPR